MPHLLETYSQSYEGAASVDSEGEGIFLLVAVFALLVTSIVSVKFCCLFGFHRSTSVIYPFFFAL